MKRDPSCPGFLFAELALERRPHAAGAPFFREHPWPAHERRLVANVLPVPAGQVSDPIAVLILVKSDDRLSHGACVVMGADTDRAHNKLFRINASPLTDEMIRTAARE